MLRSFLSDFSQLIEKISETRMVDEDDPVLESSVVNYGKLSAQDRSSFLAILQSFDDVGVEYRLLLELFCFSAYKDPVFAGDILDTVINSDMDYRKKYNYLFSVSRGSFVNGISISYEKRLAVEEQIVRHIRSTAQIFPDHIPYKDRNKKSVVIIMNPFLGAYHAPSIMAINLAYYLETSGYSTYFVSVSDNEILKEHAADVYGPFIRNTLFEGIQKFEYTYSDRVIKGLHFDLREETMDDDINALAVHIAELAPEFVIGVEGFSPVADICTYFTDVVIMNVVDDLPVTMSPYVLRYFKGELKNFYVKAEELGKTVFNAPFVKTYVYYDDDEEIPELPKDRFLVLVMGNRLDNEVGAGMTDLLRKITDEVPEADLVFIGKCPALERRFEDMADRCHFLGYVRACEDAIGKCSLFLNPPRAGGGGGGYMAIKRSVPVYTLKDCDVAGSVGEEFAHDSYDELIPYIRKCIDDKAFYDGQKDTAKRNYMAWEGVDSAGNISRFTKELNALINH